MKVAQRNYLRFVSLRLRDYKVFGGQNDLRFIHNQTLIVGENGTGKTIIAEVLSYLGPPKMTPNQSIVRGRFTPAVAVVTEGNSDLAHKYRDLIFIQGDSIGTLALYIREFQEKFKIEDSSWEAVENEMKLIFEKILSFKPWKIKTYKDLKPDIMAAGERICLGHAVVFALRKMLRLDIPVVIDSPYGRLDAELRQGMSDFLKKQPCQQILFVNEKEFLDRENPTYILVHTENYSHVMEF